MSSTQAPPRRDLLGAWCGWLVVVGLALTPVFAWINPRGIAVFIGALGLLALPAVRVTDRDRPVAVVLLLALIWAGASTVWSPFHASKLGNNTALKLALQLPLYWSFMCAARRATPKLQRRALAVFALMTSLLGVVLLAEFVLDAMIYEKIHFAFYKPIRHDLAEVAIAHTAFIGALLWPLALAAAQRVKLTPWIVVPIIAGVVTSAGRFGAEAPVLSMAFVAAAGVAAVRWPRGAPTTIAAAAVIYSLAAPGVIWAVRASGHYGDIEKAIELSWSMRMGFWSHAVDWIGDHPLRGWGLDASRVFGPGIVLHPHDTALQVWLELGAVGAVLAAAFWWLAIRRLARPRPEMAAVAVTASTTVFLLFSAINFGAWQEWWLALGGLVAALAGLLMAPAASKAST
jgi:O-antigen ligase